MESNTPIGENSDIKQTKLIPPGCQVNYRHILSSNEIYFCYASTMTINVFDNRTFQIKCILNPNLEKLVKCLCLNVGRNKELAVYYEEEIIMFDVEEERIIQKIKLADVAYMEFNTENKMSILIKGGNLYYYDMPKKKVEPIKTADKVNIVRWYPFNSTDLAYSTKNTVYYHNAVTKSRVSEMELNIGESWISELSWYTLDENYKYILAGMSDGYAVLLDISQQIVIMSFEKYANDVLCMVWLKYEPGTFFTCSKKSGRVAFWNVSKKNYNEIAKFADSSIIWCQPMHDANRVLMCLENGSILVYDVKNRKQVFALEANHSETIFDLQYHPTTYGIMATCSYDSTIKIWNAVDNKILWNVDVDEVTSRLEKKKESTSELKKERLHLYALRWSPVDHNLIAGGDSKAGLRIFDIDKQRYVTGVRLSTNSQAHIVGLDWEKTNNLVATCLDLINVCNYESGKLTLIKSFKTAADLFQIKFDPFDSSIYAVASLDNSIKIFSFFEEKPYKTLTGHSRKVFGLTFNPKRKGILSSTSDDFKIGIWDLEKNSNFFLSGHKNNTRHSVWLPDYPHILVTSSWDGDIRVWNIDQAACIGEITEHYSDVYGIDINPHHPFLLTSCSRDNSIRFFNLSISPRKLTECIVNFDKIQKLDLKNHQKLEEKLKALQEVDSIAVADVVTNYFFYHDGLKDFWDIIKVVSGRKEYCDPGNKIFYVTDLYSAYRSRVQNLEFSYYSKTKFNYSVKKEDLLNEAIDFCAKVGDWEKFCELSVEGNKWEQAIMAAPNVSISYWKELTKKYAEYSTNKNLPQKSFASLLSNQMQPALKNAIDSGDYEDAKIIWLTRGNNPSTEDDKKTSTYSPNWQFIMDENTLKGIQNKLNNLSEEEGLKKVTYLVAKQHLIKGFPILAAASFVSIKDTFNTLKSLVRTAEFDVAYITMKLLKEYWFEPDIMMSLCLKELRRGGVENCKIIIANTESIDVKVTLAFMVKNSKKHQKSIFELFNLPRDEIIQNLSKSKNKFLSAIIENDSKSCTDLFFSQTKDLANSLSANKPDIDVLANVIKLMFYMKAVDLTNVDNMEKVLFRMCVVAAFLEAVNNNVKACAYHLFNISRSLGRSSCAPEEEENTLLSFACTFLKTEKQRHEDGNLKLHKSLIDMSGSFKNISKALETFRKCGEKSVCKYYCDDIPYFFCIRDEIFPVNISKHFISYLNGRKIRGSPVKVRENFLLSISQSLEWFKFIPTSPGMDEYQLFNPY